MKTNMIPQIIFLSLLAMVLGMIFERHGEPEEGNYNGWSALLGAAIWVTLLYWGGFFDCFFKP